MAINQRLTGVEALFGKRIDGIKKYLDGFSKDRPADIAPDLFRAIMKTEELRDYWSRIRIRNQVNPDNVVTRRATREELLAAYRKFKAEELSSGAVLVILGEYLGEPT